MAHHDTPDCGNSEIFISLVSNAHLDRAYGGYCVFAQVLDTDAASWATISAIAAAVKAGQKPAVVSVAVVEG